MDENITEAYPDIEKYSKEDILSLPITEMLSSFEDRKYAFVRFLKGIFDNELIKDSDVEDQDTSEFIQTIAANIDWDKITSSTYGEDIFFNGEHGLYSNLQRAIQDAYSSYSNDYKTNIDIDWEEHWNESLSDLLKMVAERIDPNSTYNYEKSGLLIEISNDQNREGEIDTEHLRAGLYSKHGKAALRIIDIVDADAGNSFTDGTDTYEYCRFYENINIKITKPSGTVVDNIGTNVLFHEKANTILEHISNGDPISTEDRITLNSLVISGIDDEGDKYAVYGNIEAGTVSIEGEYVTFKVVRNPWVIPWYNIDGNTYSKVRGEDKKLSVLCDEDRLQFTRTQDEETSSWIRLLMPTHKRKVEVEDLNRNFWVIGQVITGLCIDLFDENGPINGAIKQLLKEVGELWENVTYLWAAFALLSQKHYYDIHTEVVMINSGYFSNNTRFDLYGTISNDEISAQLNNLIDKYSEYSLLIVPYVRDINYEKNYYRCLIIPGAWFYDRNKENPQWEIKLFYDFNGDLIGGNGHLVIDLQDYQNSLYGILENEFDYKYIVPLTRAGNTSAQDGARYYGLSRDKISVRAEFGDNLKLEDTRTIIQIALEDTGKGLIDNNAQNFYRVKFQFDGAVDGFSLIEQEINPPVLAPAQGSKTIEKGYYQGEMLSCYANSTILAYAIKMIYVELPPEYPSINTGTIRNNPTVANSTKYDHANAIIQSYFNKYVKTSQDYNSDCVYILIGHFHYTTETTHDGYGDSNTPMTYYDLVNNEAVPISTVDDHVVYRASQGIDTGLVIILPEALQANPIVYSWADGGEGLWDYSRYVNLPVYSGSDPPSDLTGSVFGGNSAYRIDLFLNEGESTIGANNWVIKYSTLANVSSAARYKQGTADYVAGWVDTNYREGNNGCGHRVVPHDWNRARTNPPDYVTGSWINKYNIMERIFVHYFTPTTLVTHKLERTNIDSMTSASRVADLSISFTSVWYGGASAPALSNNVTVQDGYNIQGAGTKRQCLDVNKCINTAARTKSKYDYSDYPDYEQFPNDGYNY